MQEIDSVDHPLMLRVRALMQTSGIREQQACIVDDAENIQQALVAGLRIQHAFFYGDHASRYTAMLEQLGQHGAELHSIRPRTCKKVFGVEKMSRFFAIAELPTQPTIQLLSGTTTDIATLDGLMMMGNIGAIIRSAVAFSQKQLVILERGYHELFDRRLIRASRGYVFRIPLLCISTADFLAQCKKQQLQIVVMDSSKGVEIDELTKVSARLAVIMGAEKTGPSATVHAQADQRVRIPISADVESLNVSVAAGIMLHALAKKQRQGMA